MSPIYDNHGIRKYLTADERAAFLRATNTMPREPKLFCRLLAYTGARLTEVLSLTAHSFDFDEGLVVIESLKKRRRGMFRAVPLPPRLMAEIDEIFDIRAIQHMNLNTGERLWRFKRTTAWKHVKVGMSRASVSGVHASPKGLRHTFAISALQAGIPISLVKKWLGHAKIETTAIYAEVIGKEEIAFAEKLWRGFH